MCDGKMRARREPKTIITIFTLELKLPTVLLSLTFFHALFSVFPQVSQVIEFLYADAHANRNRAHTHTLIHSFALIQSIVHHYHNKLYEVIYVYADSKISDLLLLQNYLHMHQFNCKHRIPSLSVCSTLITSAKQCAARFQCCFMLKSFKML